MVAEVGTTEVPGAIGGSFRSKLNEGAQQVGLRPFLFALLADVSSFLAEIQSPMYLIFDKTVSL